MAEKPALIDMCPKCHSAPRHRLAYYLLDSKLGTGHNVLHVAPLPFIEKWLRSVSTDYLSIDLTNERPVMQLMDLTDLAVDNDSVTLIWAAHVLEHIPDDRKAMAEMFRVLKKDGLAIILVPIGGNETYEDDSVQTDEGRLKHFLQEDHVRFYGLDIAERLEGIGFEVEVLDIKQVPENHIRRYGLEYPLTREVFLCRKP
jgi:SAM-dependent methyltransferase